MFKMCENEWVKMGLYRSGERGRVQPCMGGFGGKVV